jgi:hypothetical protein
VAEDVILEPISTSVYVSFMKRGAFGVVACISALACAHEAHAGTLWVVFPGQANPCDFDEFSAALRARVADADVRVGLHDVDASDAVVAFERSGDNWTLEVRAVNEPPMRRSLPKPGVDCSALSEAAALMVDRYLDDIHWTGAGTEAEKLVPLPPLPPPPHFQFAAEASGFGGLLTAGTLLGAGLDFGLRRGAWVAEVGGAVYFPVPVQFELSTDPTQPQGSLQVTSARTDLAVGRRFEFGPGAVRVEICPGVDLFWVSASGGTLFHQVPQLGVVPMIGALLGYDLHVNDRFFVALRASGRLLLTQETFYVEGFSTTVQTQRFEAELSLALGTFLF